MIVVVFFFFKQYTEHDLRSSDWSSDVCSSDLSVSFAKSTERESGSIGPANFERKFEDEGLLLGLNFADMRRPLYTVDGDADAVEAFFDPSEYELDSVQVTALSDSRDKEWSAK